MKKILLFLMCVFLFVAGCGKQSETILDINTIDDIIVLQNLTIDISERFVAGDLSSEDAKILLMQIQDRYLELTDVTTLSLESQFATLRYSLAEDAIPAYVLPFWAKRKGMVEPQNMELDLELSQQYITSDGYDTTILVYHGEYDVALEEAKHIADNAGLEVSKVFVQGQTIAQGADVSYISGLDFGILAKGIVYANHDLLAKNMEYLLSVAVDQNGTLTIETVTYK